MINLIILWILFYLTGCLLAYLISKEIAPLVNKIGEDDEEFKEILNDCKKKYGDVVEITKLEIALSWISVLSLTCSLLLIAFIFTLQYINNKL